MILPFMSFAWSPYAGKYGMTSVRIMCDVPNAGRLVAPHFRSRPKGRRVAIFQNAEYEGKLFSHPDDRLNGRHRGLWWSAGITATQKSFGKVIDQLWAAKADLDYAAFDVESGINFWSITEEERYAIHADPRYENLVATGRFPGDCRVLSREGLGHFNYGCAYLYYQALIQALVVPLYKRYNNLNWSNFGDFPLNKADAPFVPEYNGHLSYTPDPGSPYFSPAIYAGVGNLGLHDPRFKEPFYMNAWQTNFLRSAYRAKPTAKLMPWVAPRLLSNVLDNTTWTELIFHVCCLSGTNLLYFNGDDYSALTNWRLDNALAQFVAQSRGKTWKSVLTTDLIRYDTARFIHSACRLADNSVLGRVMFKPGVDTASFAVGGKNYTVRRPAGAVGAWFYG